MGGPAPRRLVLVVDPDPMVRLALDRQIERLGYDVVCVNQGEEVVRAVTLGLRPDALVIASRLPDLDGAPFVEALRPFVPDLRVVVLEPPIAAAGVGLPDRRLAVGTGPTMVVGPWSHDRLADALVLALPPEETSRQPR